MILLHAYIQKYLCFHVVYAVSLLFVSFFWQPPQLSKKEIEDLLKKGAYGAVMESDDAANQ